MSLPVIDRSGIPADTAELGRELMAEDNLYRQLGDKLADLIKDEDFAWMYSPIGGPGISPVILALVTVLQLLEKLPDRIAAEMVRMRIDWKYALHLPLNWAGFYWTNLSHFRQRLLDNEAEYLVFDKLVQKLVELGFMRHQGKQRTDSMSILGLVAKLSRLELVLETLRVALAEIKQVDAGWLAKHVPVSYLERYQSKRQTYKMTEEEIKTELGQVGADGLWLLQQVKRGPSAIQGLAKVTVLAEIWEQQFEWDETGNYAGPRLKLEGHGLIQSPHEPEVRYREKREKHWQGYVAQVSETAEAKGEVNFITDLGATDAQASDVRSLPEVQQRLVERGVAPEEQDVDQAYVSGTSLAQSETQGIKLVGAIAPEVGPKEFKLSDFAVDVTTKTATCPAGQTAAKWNEQRRADGTVQYTFHFGEPCATCPLRPRCTEAPAGRTISYHEHHPQVEQCRAEMLTPEFKAAMKRRAPVEGTISQLARGGGRHARYRGLRKVNLQLVFTAVGINLRRLGAAWAKGYTPSWAAAGGS